MFDAFISYSHAADGTLAAALQQGLHRFAKPFFKLRAIRVFRDETTLAMTPSLWPDIEKALRDSSAAKTSATGLNTLSVAEESLTVYERTEPSDQRHTPEYKRSIAKYGVNNRKWIS